MQKDGGTCSQLKPQRSLHIEAMLLGCLRRPNVGHFNPQDLHTNKVHTGSEHPCIQGEDKKFLPDLNHRYLAEDCPTGLCFSKGLAELCDISTPTIDKVISWAQQSLGKEWLGDGKMQGKNVSETRAPQGVGIKTIDEFVIAAKFHAGQ